MTDRKRESEKERERERKREKERMGLVGESIKQHATRRALGIRESRMVTCGMNNTFQRW